MEQSLNGGRELGRIEEELMSIQLSLGGGGGEVIARSLKWCRREKKSGGD